MKLFYQIDCEESEENCVGDTRIELGELMLEDAEEWAKKRYNSIGAWSLHADPELYITNEAGVTLSAFDDMRGTWARGVFQRYDRDHKPIGLCDFCNGKTNAGEVCRIPECGCVCHQQKAT